MNRTVLAATLTLLAGSTLSSALGSARDVIGSCPPPMEQQPIAPGGCFPQQSPPKVEVVFVLDTTGSMGGLIEGAKQKIWSIATTIAQAQPAPELRMGLIGYRDRGDAYVTTRTALTRDMDAMYSDLMRFEAGGGGDTPESVNEAVFEAVERFDWTSGPGVLRIIYLVGDAPPKMEYQDDVKYMASCKLAREKGILINTIQCGALSGTREVWQEIAQNAGGAYAAIPQDGGVQVCVTPYDSDIAQLDRELAGLMIDYGDGALLLDQYAKREMAERISADAAPAAAADRAVYNQTASGGANLYGRQELVVDVMENGKDLSAIPAEELPESLRGNTVEETRAVIEQNHARRVEIRSRMAELARQRADFQAKAAAEGPSDGFDAQVVETLRVQGAAVGLTIDPAN